MGQRLYRPRDDLTPRFPAPNVLIFPQPDGEIL